MEYIIDVENIKNQNIIIKLPIKNQNNKYINYYKIIYSNSYFNLKYLIIQLHFTNYSIKSDNLNYKLIVHKKDLFLNYLKQMETTILNVLNYKLNKKIITNIYNDLINRESIYTFNTFPNLKQFYIKISGICENNTEIGLVYKFYYNISTEKLSNILC